MTKTTEQKTSKEIYDQIHHHTFPYCGCKSIQEHSEEVNNFKQKKWLPDNKAISLDLHKKMQDENFDMRKKLIEYKNKSVLVREELIKEISKEFTSEEKFRFLKIKEIIERVIGK